MEKRVFSGRSMAIGVATGVVVSVVLGAFGTGWGLACMTGLAGGSCVLALCTALGDPRFNGQPVMTARQRGPSVIASIVILAPALNLSSALRHAPDAVNPFIVSLLILLTGFAAYGLGIIVGALSQIEGDDAPPTGNPLGLTTASDDTRRSP